MSRFRSRAGQMISLGKGTVSLIYPIPNTSNQSLKLFLFQFQQEIQINIRFQKLLNFVYQLLLRHSFSHSAWYSEPNEKIQQKTIGKIIIRIYHIFRTFLVDRTVLWIKEIKIQMPPKGYKNPLGGFIGALSENSISHPGVKNIALSPASEFQLITQIEPLSFHSLGSLKQ